MTCNQEKRFLPVDYTLKVTGTSVDTINCSQAPGADGGRYWPHQQAAERHQRWYIVLLQWQSTLACNIPRYFAFLVHSEAAVDRWIAKKESPISARYKDLRPGTRLSRIHVSFPQLVRKFKNSRSLDFYVVESALVQYSRLGGPKDKNLLHASPQQLQLWFNSYTAKVRHGGQLEKGPWRERNIFSVDGFRQSLEQL